MLQHVAVVLALVGLSLPSAARAQTVDDLVARNLEAKGGLDRIRAVETLRMTGRTSIGPGGDAPFVMEIKRPNKMRMDVTLQGQTMTQAFDGKTGWQVVPFSGKNEPQELPPQATRGLAEQADFYGPLVDAKSKGIGIEYAGVVKLDTGEAHKLVLTMKGGEKRSVFLDAKTFLEVRGEATMQAPGRTMEIVNLIGDYRPVDGVVLPHRMESGRIGAPMRARMTVDKIELNVPIDDARFAKPERADEK
jgi:outer membrane lipoprotein-sorting protein